MPSDLPLSSHWDIPMTDSTRAALTSLGVVPPIRLTEGGAQALLAVSEQISTGDVDSPSCWQREYSPADTICAGCVFAARCWSGDGRYLTALLAGTVPPPPGVPPRFVVERLARMPSAGLPPPPPPVVAAPLPPPPPPAKRR